MPDTEMPTRPVTLCTSELSPSTAPAMECTPTASSIASPNTTVEWSSVAREEAHGQRPLAIGSGVVLSMAAVVGVEGVPHAQHVGRDAHAQAEAALEVLRHHHGQQDEEARRVHPSPG